MPARGSSRSFWSAARHSAVFSPQAASAAADDTAFLERAFETILLRGPSPEERTACEAAIAKWRSTAKPAAGAPDPGQVLLVWALVNHNDFVTLR